MAKFHFVEDYERHVANLIATHPIDEAMSLVVGGAYEEVGAIEADILAHIGIQNGMSIFDLGCGSGRLAVALSKRFEIEFTGTDVVQQLLDYAAAKSPADYRFILHEQLTIPAPDASIDILSSFSVFTHLLHEETYIYLVDGKRILKSGGFLLFSYIEFGLPMHWGVFEGTIRQRAESSGSPLNTFIESSAIRVWAEHLGLEVVALIPGFEHPWGERPLGQSVAVLRKP